MMAVNAQAEQEIQVIAIEDYRSGTYDPASGHFNIGSQMDEAYYWNNGTSYPISSAPDPIAKQIANVVFAGNALHSAALQIGYFDTNWQHQLYSFTIPAAQVVRYPGSYYVDYINVVWANHNYSSNIVADDGVHYITNSGSATDNQGSVYEWTYYSSKGVGIGSYPTNAGAPSAITYGNYLVEAMTATGLTWTDFDTDYTNIYNLWKTGHDGGSPAPIQAGGYTWNYMATLPGQEGHVIGDTWTIDGTMYMYLGSGAAGALGGGSAVPEPSTIVSILSGLMLLNFRRMFKMKKK
jgi:hypothetical protein